MDNQLKYLADAHAQKFNEDQSKFISLTGITCSTIAGATNKENEIMRVDKVFKGLEGEMARLQEMGSIAAKLAKAPNGPQRNALIEEAIRTLESPGFGDEAAADAYKKSDEYKSFVEANRTDAPKIAEGMDLDDDLAVVGGASNDATKDPFTLAPLCKEKDTGKYPVKMPCSHIYNWSTVMGRNKKNGDYSVLECGVAGCTKKSWPMDRSGLMEDPKTRNMVERIAKGIGASQMSLANNSSGAVDLYDDFDDV